MRRMRPPIRRCRADAHRGVPRAKVKPTLGLRQDFYVNDMRSGWAPTSPTLLCGGSRDPTVFFEQDTGTMAAYWGALPAGLITVLDVNAAPSGPFSKVQTEFQASLVALLAYYQSAAGGGLSLAAAEQAVFAADYHVAVAPFCTAAARAFFGKF